MYYHHGGNHQVLPPRSTVFEEANLYYAKLKYEEQLKQTLVYQLNPESPLDYVDQFFKNTFPAEELADASASPVA